MIKHRLTLDYTLEPGWMKPFVDGVTSGKAVARQCISCSQTCFPPTRSCICGETDANWIELSGIAHISFRTEGVDGDFALVKFEGADTHSIVRLRDIRDGETTGQIIRPDRDLPMMILGPVGDKAST